MCLMLSCLNTQTIINRLIIYNECRVIVLRKAQNKIDIIKCDYQFYRFDQYDKPERKLYRGRDQRRGGVLRQAAGPKRIALRLVIFL